MPVDLLAGPLAPCIANDVAFDPPGLSPPAEAASCEPIVPIRWAELAERRPPERRFAWQNWLPTGAVTALYGPGGVGKSLLAQQLATAVALDRPFLGEPTDGRPVLAIFAEEDDVELWRRQERIVRDLGIGLAALDGRLFLQGRFGRTNLLAERRFGRLEEGPFLASLHDACTEHRPGLLVLDNVALLFGGDENDRGEVSRFVGMLGRIAQDHDCAVLIVGHTAKAEGSEYSGSTAWNAAVRSRWLLQRPPADKRGARAERIVLARVKSNYAPPAELELLWRDGILALAAAEPRDRLAEDLRQRRAMQRVLDGLDALRERGIVTSASRNATNYAPKLLAQHGLDRDPEEPERPFDREELGKAIVALLEEGRLHAGVPVSRTKHRHPRCGLGRPEWGDASAAARCGEVPRDLAANLAAEASASEAK